MSDSKNKFLSLQKERIRNSGNFSRGQFQNLETTEVMGLSSMFKMLKAFREKPADVRPQTPLPVQKVDFENISENQNTLIWFGHSSYFLQVDKIKILVDPVFSGHASPFSFMIKAFAGTQVVKAEDLPHIDVLLLTHDHYDHLDSAVVKKIRPRVRNVVCSLGVGKHLVHWGLEPSAITELDWWEDATLSGLRFTAVPGRHFSGRGLQRMKSLWSAFILESKDRSLFLGGDSGYGKHFKEIAKKFNGFDLAIMESGQYNELWSSIHMMPEETVQAALDLNARCLLPVHWGKFALAMHSWTEPIERVLKAAENKPLKICTPMIGEQVSLDEELPDEKWWRNIG